MALSAKDLTPQQQWIAAGVLGGLLLLVFWWQFWMPNAATMDRLERQAADLRLEVAEMQAIAAGLPEMQEELAVLERRLGIVRKILPEEYETADLLRGVGTIAAQSNLDIRDLAFKDPVPYEFYAESPIELELVGSYHDLGRFFDRIGKFARIINVDEVDIEALDGTSDDTVTATITAMTFIFIDSDGAPPEPAAAPGRRGRS